MLTILSLCDLTGNWSRPYEEAGYDVIRIDLQAGQDVRLLRHLGRPVHGILAAPPCDHFALSGARRGEVKVKGQWVGENWPGKILGDAGETPRQIVMSDTLKVDNSAAPITLSVAGGDEPDSLASRLRWMTGDRDRHRDRVDELLAEAARLDERHRRDREEIHRLRNEVEGLRMQEQFWVRMARAHPRPTEGGR